MGTRRKILERDIFSSKKEIDLKEYYVRCEEKEASKGRMWRSSREII